MLILTKREGSKFVGRLVGSRPSFLSIGLMIAALMRAGI